MSTVGDVVFCVDCDLARNAHLQAAAGAAGHEPPHEHPRRMATKKDKNDALCAACLDARLQRRRAEFELRQVAPTPTESQAAPAQPRTVVEAPVRRLSEIRIARVRPPVESAPENGAKRAAREPEPEPELRPAAARVAKADDRKLERTFLELGVAIGFVRAHELLDELRTHAMAVADRAS